MLSSAYSLLFSPLLFVQISPAPSPSKSPLVQPRSQLSGQPQQTIAVSNNVNANAPAGQLASGQCATGQQAGLAPPPPPPPPQQQAVTAANLLTSGQLSKDRITLLEDQPLLLEDLLEQVCCVGTKK